MILTSQILNREKNTGTEKCDNSTAKDYFPDEYDVAVVA